MKNIVYLLTFSIILLGCGSKQIPDWKNASFNQLENYKKSYLGGKEQSAELYFNRAVDEIKKSGDLELVARAYLTKYAVHVAVIEAFDDGEYLRIDALQPVLQNSNFYNFLKGSFDTVDERLLPQQYDGFLRAFRKGNIEDIAHEISRIEDPLSKLIAVGLLVQKNMYDEGILKIAIDTASHNGWKRALLVYLDKLQSFYEMKKETQKAANIKQKIQLIKK
jgi:hypothetical protein